MTLDQLANAFRGMPRGAHIMIELPDGTLAPLRSVRVAHLSGEGEQLQEGATGGAYGLVMSGRDAMER